MQYNDDPQSDNDHPIVQNDENQRIHTCVMRRCYHPSHAVGYIHTVDRLHASNESHAATGMFPI